MCRWRKKHALQRMACIYWKKGLIYILIYPVKHKNFTSESCTSNRKWSTAAVNNSSQFKFCITNHSQFTQRVKCIEKWYNPYHCTCLTHKHTMLQTLTSWRSLVSSMSSPVIHVKPSKRLWIYDFVHFIFNVTDFLCYHFLKTYGLFNFYNRLWQKAEIYINVDQVSF